MSEASKMWAWMNKHGGSAIVGFRYSEHMCCWVVKYSNFEAIV